MNITVCQRLMLILEDKQVSVNALSKKVNMSQTTLNTQLKGERALSANVVEKILEVYPDVSSDWVMRGKGTMYDSDKSETNIVDATSVAMVADPIHYYRDEPQQESIWQAKYEELEKRYDQLLSILGGGMRQSKVNVG